MGIAGAAREHLTMNEAHTVGRAVTAGELLDMKVAAILAAHDGALEVLASHGFAPLRQPHLRAVLANTVTLSQAARIRSLTADQERALLDELVSLFSTTTGEAAG